MAIISGNQWPSVAISGHQWPSELFTRSRAADQPRFLAAPDGRTHLMREAIRGNQRQSEVTGSPRWTHSPPRARGAALDGSASAGCGIRSSRWKAMWQAAGRSRPSSAPPPAECKRWTRRTSSVASGTQRAIRWPSEGSQRSISGNHRQSVALSGNQWPLPEAGRGTRGAVRNQWQSVALSGTQWHSVAISGRYLRQGEVLEEPLERRQRRARL